MRLIPVIRPIHQGGRGKDKKTLVGYSLELWPDSPANFYGHLTVVPHYTFRTIKDAEQYATDLTQLDNGISTMPVILANPEDNACAAIARELFKT